MLTECSQDSFDFGSVERRRVVAAFDGGTMTSDGGALLLGATDKAIGLVGRFSACFSDARDPGLIEHSLETLVGQRVFGLALGYEDLNDHDQLRHDPVMAVLAGKLDARRKECAPVAGKSTLNRLEQALRGGVGRYHKIGYDARAIEALFIDLFLESYEKPPKRITLDLDATDDPLLLRLLLLPAALHHERTPPARRQAAARQHRCRAWRARGSGAHRRAHPPGLA